MTIRKLILMMVCLLSIAVEPKEAPKEAKVTPLFSKDLADLPGKEGVMITVEYPPGSSDPIHRHNAHAFALCTFGSPLARYARVVQDTTPCELKQGWGIGGKGQLCSG
jgi:hypothetical protein